MAYQNAYSAYQKNNVSTASQGRLVVLLYEGAIKHLTAAKKLFGQENKLKPNQIEQFGIHIQKTQAIITELQVSLDMEKGGEIAKNLMSLYLFFLKLYSFHLHPFRPFFHKAHSSQLPCQIGT